MKKHLNVKYYHARNLLCDYRVFFTSEIKKKQIEDPHRAHVIKKNRRYTCLQYPLRLEPLG